ncbi:MAG TPA: fibronectin type III domain-containing protein, partial [Candidatus Thermoplasmatota archaeon]|nr:fibronectin type III domain-containing protein [Candidatus Thermoplasmatota archaeon]
MRGIRFLTSVCVLLFLAPTFAPFVTATADAPAPGADKTTVPGPLLRQVFGNASFSPSPDPAELLHEAARALNLSLDRVTFTPILDAERPLANALQAWVLQTGAAVPDAELSAQLVAADQLPLDLQRSLATVILGTLEARRLEQIALSTLSDEERAFAAANRGALVEAPDSPTGKRMQEIAAKVDLAKSLEAALVLLSVLEREQATLKAWSARLSDGNEAQIVVRAVEPYLPLLAEGDTRSAARLALAEEVVARAAGFQALPRPYTHTLDERHPLAVALADLAGAFGLGATPEVLAEIQAADALPADLQRAVALIVYAKAEAIVAEGAAHLPGVTTQEAAALSVKAQLNLLSALSQAGPALQFWGEVFRHAPAMQRLTVLNSAFAPSLAVLETKAFTKKGLTPTDALAQAFRVRGLDVTAAAVPTLAPGEALKRLYASEGKPLSTEMADAMNKAILNGMDPTLSRALVDLLSALAFADAETREALKALTLAEREQLARNHPTVEGLLAEVRSLTPAERAFVLNHLRTADKVDFERLAAAALALSRAAEEARARLDARLNPAPRASTGPGLAFLSLLSPFGTARAQATTGIACMSTPFSSCANDIYFTDPAGLVAVTGEKGSLFLGRQLLVLDLGGPDGHYGSAGGANGGQDLSPVSLVLDLGGKDQYENSTRLAQGAASFGIGLLFDYGPDTDLFNAQNQAQGYGYFGVGLLFNEGGDDRYTAFQDAQGRGAGLSAPGVGLLLDRTGNDRYQASRSQGFGFGGLLVDSAGRDQYGPEGKTLGVPLVQPPLFSERTDNALWMHGPATPAGDAGVGLDFDPQDADLDRDQWPDILERLAGSNPRDPKDTPDKGLSRTVTQRTTDSDRDGVLDEAERFVGTNPHDAQDHFFAAPSIPSYPPGTPLRPLNQVLGMAPGEFRSAWMDNRETAGDQVRERNVSYARGFILNVGLPTVPLVAASVTVPAILRVNPNGTVRASASAANGTGEGDGRSTGVSTDVDPNTDPQRPANEQPLVNDVPNTPLTNSFEFGTAVRLFALGDTVPTTYRSEYLLSIDLGGDDLYRNAPGGAVQANFTPNFDRLQGAFFDLDGAAPQRRVYIPTLAIDASGNDRYEARLVMNRTGVPTPLSGQGSMGGILADLEGNDVYVGGPNSQGAAGNPNPSGNRNDVNSRSTAAGILIDLDGADRYDASDDSQGSGGFLLDLGPQADRYVAGNRSQGYGGVRPYTPVNWTDYGLLLDLGGDDTYDAASRRGAHSQAVAGPGSVGLLVDLGGTDTYHAYGPVSQGALLPSPEHNYRRIQEDVQKEDVQPNNPGGAAPNLRRLRSGPAVAGHVDLDGFDTYLVTAPALGGGLLTTSVSAARNNHLGLERTPATIRAVSPPGTAVNGLAPTPQAAAFWNLALRADTTTEENLDGKGGVTAWLGSDPTNADDGDVASALKGFLVNLPLAGLAIGAPEATEYRVPYALTIDLGGDDRYLNNPAGPFGVHLAGTRDTRVPSDTTGLSGTPVDLRANPVTVALDFGGNDTWQATTGASLGAGLLSVGLVLDDGGHNQWNGTRPALALKAPRGPVADYDRALVNLTGNGTAPASYWPGTVGQRLTLATRDGLTLPVEVRARHDGHGLALQILVPDSTPVGSAGGDRVRLLFDGNHNHVVDAGDDGLLLGPLYEDLKPENGAFVTDEARFQNTNGTRVYNATMTCAGSTTPGCWVYLARKSYTDLDPRDFLLQEGDTLAFSLEVVDAGPGTLRSFEAPASLEDWPTLTLLREGETRPADHYHLVPATQAYAVGGVGLLLATGTSRANDVHLAGDRSLAYAGVNGVALLLDLGGSDRYESTSLSQAATEETAQAPAVAALLDVSGNDAYLAKSRSQGWRGTASPLGAAAFLDVVGDDYYRYDAGGNKVKVYPQDGRSFPPSHLNGWGWTQGGVGADLDTVDRVLGLLGSVHVNQQLCQGQLAGLKTLEETATGNPAYAAAGALTYALLGNDLTFVGDQVCPSMPRSRDYRASHAVAAVREATPTGCGNAVAPHRDGPLVKGVVCLTAVTDLPQVNGRPVAVERVDFILRSLPSEPGLPLGTATPDGTGRFTLRWDSTRFLGTPLGDGHYRLVPRVYLALDANPEADRVMPVPEAPSWAAGAYYEDGVQLEVRLDNKPQLTGLAVEPASYSRFAPVTENGRAELRFDLTRDLQEDVLSGGGLDTDPTLRRVPCSGDPTRLCDKFPLYFLPFDPQGYVDSVFENTDNVFRVPVQTPEPKIGFNESPEHNPNILLQPAVCLLDTGAKPIAGEATLPPSPGSKPLDPPDFLYNPRRFNVQDAQGSIARLMENVTAFVNDTQRFVRDVQDIATGLTGGYLQGIVIPYAVDKVGNLTDIGSGLVSDGSCLLTDLQTAVGYVGNAPSHYRDPPYVGNYTGRLSTAPPTSAAPTGYVLENAGHVNFTLTERLTDPFRLGPDRGRDEKGRLIAPLSVRVDRNPTVAGNHITEVTLWETRVVEGFNGALREIITPVARQRANASFEAASLPLPVTKQASQPVAAPGYKELRGHSFERENPYLIDNPLEAGEGNTDQGALGPLLCTNNGVLCRGDGTIGSLVDANAAAFSGNTLPGAVGVYRETWGTVNDTFRAVAERTDDGLRVVNNPPTVRVEGWDQFTRLSYLPGRENYQFHAGATLTVTVTAYPPAQEAGFSRVSSAQELWIGATGYEGHLSLEALTPVVAANTVSATLTSRDGTGTPYPLLLVDGNKESTTLKIPGGAYGPDRDNHVYWDGYYRNPFTERREAVPDGDYLLEMRVVDATGATTVTRGFVTVDNEAPTTLVALPRHAGLDATPGNALTLTWTGDDHGGSGISHYRVKMARELSTPLHLWSDLKPDGSVAAPGTPEAALRFTGTAVRVPLDPSQGREYHFLVVAVDRAGNIETPLGGSAQDLEEAFALRLALGPASTTLDLLRPEHLVSVSYRGLATGEALRRAGPQTPGLIEACVRDPPPGSGIQSVTLKAFKEVPGAAPLANTHALRPTGEACLTGSKYAFADWARFMADKARYPPGTWSYYVSVVDLAGNEARSEEERLTVDNDAPVLQGRVLYPPGQSAAKLGDNVTIQVKGMDAGGIRTLLLDGSALTLATGPREPRYTSLNGEPGYEATFQVDRPVRDGLHPVVVTALDDVGNPARIETLVLVVNAVAAIPEEAGVLNGSHDRVTLAWRTRDAATALVRYGTDPFKLNLEARNLTLGTTHTVELTGLAPSSTYYYRAASVSPAGKITESPTLGRFNTSSALTVNLLSPTPAVPAGRDLAIRWTGGHPAGIPVRYDLSLAVPDLFRTRVATLTEAGHVHEVRLNASIFQDRPDYVIILTAATPDDQMEIVSPPFDLDATAPTLFGESPARATRDARPVLTVHAADGMTGLRPERATLQIDGRPVAAQITLEGDLLTMVLPEDLAEGAHLVRVLIPDGAGNPGILEWPLAVDRT